MFIVNENEFENIISTAIDSIPELYAKKMNNVAIVWEDDPTPAQRANLKLRCNESLFGLYEGVPLTSRTGNYSLVLPDRITLFRNPLQHASDSLETLNKQVAKTLWHEVAHHFGLDHDRIHQLESKIIT